jgi:hypothetical protein
MDTSWWVVIVAVVFVGVIVVVMRSRQTQADQAQDYRMSVQRQGGAQSAGEEISQREDRRLGGMSTEDRAWETASLDRQRGRDAQRQRDPDID